MGAEKIVGQRSGRTKRSVEAATKKEAWEKHRLHLGGPTRRKTNGNGKDVFCRIL